MFPRHQHRPVNDSDVRPRGSVEIPRRGPLPWTVSGRTVSFTSQWSCVFSSAVPWTRLRSSLDCPQAFCLQTRRLSDDRAKGADCLGLHIAQAPGRVHCALSGLQRHSARGPRGPQRAREATSQSRREHGTAQPVKQYFEYNTHLFLSGWRSWPEVGGRFSFDLCDVVDG